MHKRVAMTTYRFATIGSIFFGLALAALPGCADDGGSSSSKKGKDDPFAEPMAPVLVKEAVTADQPFANDVEVKDDRLVIVTAGHEAMIAKIKEGSILAGNRSLTKTAFESEDGNYGPNPYGFLRRVTKVEQEGANTVIYTKSATLDEWLQEGDIDFSDRRSLLDGKTPIADESYDAKSKTYTRNLKFLDADNQQGGGGGSGSVAINGGIGDASGGISISNATYRLNARFSGHFKVRYKELRFLPDPPTGVNFKAHLTLDPLVTADIEVSGGRSTTLAERTWRGRGAIIPIAAPIPLTIRFEPELKCSLNLDGSFAVTVGASIGAHAEAGFEGDAGFRHFDLSDLSRGPTLNGGLQLKKVTGKASLAAECKLLAVPVVLAFDAAGIQGKIGPYVKLSADLCTALSSDGPQANNSGFTISEEHGLAGEFSGRIQIPLLGLGRDFELASLSVPLGSPTYLLGNDKTCDTKQLDSCAGKPDGFYCSEIVESSGYYCENEQIARGLQCADPNKKCAGGSATEIQCR